jgi:hypothetical protein
MGSPALERERDDGGDDVEHAHDDQHREPDGEDPEPRVEGYPHGLLPPSVLPIRSLSSQLRGSQDQERDARRRLGQLLPFGGRVRASRRCRQ